MASQTTKKQSFVSYLVALSSLLLLAECYCWGRMELMNKHFSIHMIVVHPDLPACLCVHGILSFDSDCWLETFFMNA
jgi:hypothetical protein